MALRLGLFALLASASACAPAAPAAEAPALPTSAAAGIYTAEQADRGQQIFNGACTTCHNPAQFTGRMFGYTWMNEPVGALYEFIRNAMPQNDPGSLSDAEYAAIVAHILRLNDRPAGSTELPADPEWMGQVRW